VVLQLVGTSELDRGRGDTVVQVISFAFGVPPENVIVSDQNGRRLFDASRGGPGDEILAHQEEFDRTRTLRVQAALDRAYGMGLTVASVHGEWSYEESESVEQNIDPTSKAPLSEFSHETETPQNSSSRVGGAVGATSNIDTEEAGNAGSESLATTSETSKEYAVSRNTSLKRKTAPALERLSVSVVVDRSLEGDLSQIEEAVKGFAGFNPERDGFSSMVATFPGIERDDQGAPVAAVPEPTPEPMNPWLALLLERAVEIVAALAFVIILFRGLKRGQRKLEPAVKTSAGQVGRATKAVGETISDEDIDMDMLARAHVNELLESDPEKVSTLLSRWALGDSVYSRGRS
jgi:flagellar biosynthesis/type III secretory pathway M-ring protein FliF/YscJ